MKKITIKVRSAAGADDVKKLLSLAAEVFPEADVDLLQCDDPALSIVVRESSTERNAPAYDEQSVMGYGRANGNRTGD